MADDGRVSRRTFVAAQPSIFVTACRGKRQSSSDELPSGSKPTHDSAQVRAARGGIVDHASRQFLGIMLNWLSKLAGKKSRMDRVESSKERGKWIITRAQDPFDLETVDLENILNAPY